MLTGAAGLNWFDRALRPAARCKIQGCAGAAAEDYVAALEQSRVRPSWTAASPRSVGRRLPYQASGAHLAGRRRMVKPETPAKSTT